MIHSTFLMSSALCKSSLLRALANTETSGHNFLVGEYSQGSLLGGELQLSPLTALHVIGGV